jgi:hypothetical protein
MVAYGPSVGSMLASNADRDRAIDVLRAGFAEGRLTQAEFEERVERVQESRTYDQLADLTRDLPAGPWAAVSPYRERPVQPAGPSFANVALTAIVVFTLAAIVTALAVYAHLHGAAFATHTGPVPAQLQPFTQSIHPHMQPLQPLQQHMRP